MGSFQPTTGLLTGMTLQIWDADKLAQAAESHTGRKIENVSFYNGELSRKTFRGVSFQHCNFARSRFEHLTFRKCTFTKVDMTRTRFVDCTFSECKFLNCDPYYTSFTNCAVHPAEFDKCYTDDSEWNKALILFSTLRRSIERTGNGRMARVAEYYYRVWERKRLYSLWKVHETSSFFAWFGNLLIAMLTGYGERPVYIGSWMLVLITSMAVVYKSWFPYAIAAAGSSVANGHFTDYWFFSFKVFCAQGFTPAPISMGFLTCQVLEFAAGLILVALLVGSVTRKLSA
jgi:hypothetical protein